MAEELGEMIWRKEMRRGQKKDKEENRRVGWSGRKGRRRRERGGEMEGEVIRREEGGGEGRGKAR